MQYVLQTILVSFRGNWVRVKQNFWGQFFNFGFFL
mgnify:CR=1 FL=1